MNSAPGIRYLGILIPHYIMWLGGKRWRMPERGVCTECGEHREHVYMRGDETPYCSDCIMFDVAEANPSDEMKQEQRHPASMAKVASGERLEIRYDTISGAIIDGADLRAYDKALG